MRLPCFHASIIRKFVCSFATLGIIQVEIDTDTLIVASTALICSPPFVPVMAAVLKKQTDYSYRINYRNYWICIGKLFRSNHCVYFKNVLAIAVLIVYIEFRLIIRKPSDLRALNN